MTPRSPATAAGAPSAMRRPWLRTTTRCESVMTARITCSIRRMATPRALMRRHRPSTRAGSGGGLRVARGADQGADPDVLEHGQRLERLDDLEGTGEAALAEGVRPE